MDVLPVHSGSHNSIEFLIAAVEKFPVAGPGVRRMETTQAAFSGIILICGK
jgi:hypothetical protein